MNDAATKEESISKEIGRIPLKIEKTANTNITSCINAAIAPALNCHLLKRNKIYKKIINKDKIVAQPAESRISSAIVGPTLEEALK